MFLAAIMPPSNIRRIIYDYQISLFRSTGNPAALALPPHLPIAFFEAAPPSPGSLVQLEPIESTGILSDPPWLLLECGPAEEIRRLRSHLPESDTSGFYPVGRGVLLSAAPNAAVPQRLKMREDAPAAAVAPGPGQSVSVGGTPALRWKSSHVACMELIAARQDRWWEHLEYSVIWQVKLKRKID